MFKKKRRIEGIILRLLRLSDTGNYLQSNQDYPVIKSVTEQWKKVMKDKYEGRRNF